MFENKTICITGGTGSLGNALVAELLKHEPKEIRIFSRDEEKQLDMHRKFASPKLKFIVGDIRDTEALNNAMEDVDVLYHTAALKIIPVCEEYAMESIKTNLLGSLNVKKSALKYHVKVAVFVSTDKAVQPINIYGACKMIAERMWVQTGSPFCAVRYGNVIGSRGSIIPLFKALIEKKQPIPITHPEMTRFLLTLKKATEIVFYATENMMGGEVFVPKLPACNIVDLPKVLSIEKDTDGYRHYEQSDYPIMFTGIRAGEKMHEILICKDEFRRTEDRGNYYVIHPHGQYSSEISEYSSENTSKLNLLELGALLEE